MAEKISGNKVYGITIRERKMNMKKVMKGIACLLCTAMVMSTLPSWAVYAENGQIIEKTVQTATSSEASRDAEL